MIGGRGHFRGLLLLSRELLSRSFIAAVDGNSGSVRSFHSNIIMGFVFSKIFSKLVGKKEIKILILGLDNSGKTTILSTSSSYLRQTASE